MGVPMLTDVKQWLFDNTAKALSTSRVIIWVYSQIRTARVTQW
jgi:hypothetical protein